MNVIPVNAQASAKAQDDSSPSTVPSGQGLNNMFLQLLVAQLQHQSPLDPVDPTQFVGQLAQFSELSEVTEINQLLQKQLGGNSGSSDTGSSGGGSNPSAKPAAYTMPEALISSAVKAAQAANPIGSPASTVSNHQIEGVF